MSHGDNKCANCGQWAGKGHRCPTATPTTPAEGAIHSPATGSAWEKERDARLERARGAIAEANTAEPREVTLDAPERDIPGISEGHRVSATVIRMYSKHNRRETRLAISYIPADGLGRRTNGGPILPGPYASTFPLATVIDNHGGTAKESADMSAAGLEFPAVEGDRFTMDGIVWEIRDDVPLGYPRLYPVEDE